MKYRDDDNLKKSDIALVRLSSSKEEAYCSKKYYKIKIITAI